LLSEIQSDQTFFDEQFHGLKLEQAIIHSSKFENCSFVYCNFNGASFLSCRFIDCNFYSCDLSLLQVANCNITKINIESCKAIGINWTKANWSDSALTNRINFAESTINHSTFIGLYLSNIKIINCIVHDVDFRETNLTKADLSGSDLTKSIFGNTILSGADLNQARNYQINPCANKLSGAKFTLPEALALLYSMDIILDEAN
jgi:fluoroquinolone resistance protein